MQKTRQPIDSMDGSTHDIPEVMVVEGGAAGTPAAGRWNPTKEQLTMLENLYRQGLRTPTAEQIQEITGRLLKYGHIEGKNVFYWFQNHKARQRQKEKQDHLSLFRYYNHHHHHLRLPPPSFHLPPPPNVVYEPCYFQVPNNLGFYVPQPVSPTATISTIKTRSPPPIKPRSTTDIPGGFMFMHAPKTSAMFAGERNMNYRSEEETVITGKNKSEGQETLELFPMHPTGILQEPVDSAGKGSCHASRACTSSLPGGTVDRLYFDFFC